MVKVKFVDKKGKTWTATFPKASLKDVKFSAKRINPQIRSVSFARRRIRRR